MSVTIPPSETEQREREETETVAPDQGPALELDESQDGLAVLALNRPERRNALDRQLVLDLGDALETIGASASTRVVIITGRGGAFCSGADLSAIRDVPKSELPERIGEFHRLIRSIAGLPQPVIAAVEGPAVGFGADLALCCDIRIFAQSAYLEMGFVNIGLMPDGGGTHWMKEYLGPRAFEMLALGRRLTAEACLEANMANQVVGDAQALSLAATMGRELLAKPPLAVRAIKRALRAGSQEQLFQALYREAAGQEKLLGSHDFAEGVAAFLEKRAPKFKGV